MTGFEWAAAVLWVLDGLVWGAIIWLKLHELLAERAAHAAQRRKAERDRAWFEAQKKMNANAKLAAINARLHAAGK